VLRLREEEQISGKQKMIGGCRSLVILFAILGIVQASCGESEECVPLRFCSPLKEGVVKLNRDKFCGPAGFLRYCCPSQMETDSSKNKPLLKTSRIKELETENPKTNARSAVDARSVEGRSLPPKNKEDNSINECEEGETCMPMRFCSFKGNRKPSRAKFCGPVGFYHYCC